MAVDTKTARGRRELHYDSLDDLLRDAERVAGDDVTMVGNWSAGQVMRHLAITIDYSIDGFPFQFPWMLRKLLKTVMKRRFLTKPLSSGFKAPDYASSVIPDPVSPDEGLAELQTAVQRLKNESKRAPHPGLEALSVDQWNQFHLRHSELHMSFAVLPQG